MIKLLLVVVRKDIMSIRKEGVLKNKEATNYIL